MRHGKDSKKSEETGKIVDVCHSAVLRITIGLSERVISSVLMHQTNYLASRCRPDIKSENLHQYSRMMHHRSMRTTITLNEETHDFALYYARARGLTLSAAIDELIRKAVTGPVSKPEIRRAPNGFPLLPKTGQVITSEMVKKYAEDEFE